MAQSEGSHHHKVTNKASSLWRTYGQPLYSKSGLSHRISGLAPDSLISRETLSDLTSDDADLQLLEQAQSTPADIVEAITLFPSYARECTGVKNMKDREIEFSIQGWAYDPSAPRQTRKNRFLLSAARQIVGLPPLPPPNAPTSAPDTTVSPEAESDSSPTDTNTSRPNYLSRNMSSRSLKDHQLSPVDSHASSLPRTSSWARLVPSSLRRSDSSSSLLRRTDSSTSLNSDDGFTPRGPRRTATDPQRSADSKRAKYFPQLDIHTCHENLAKRIAPFLALPLRERFVNIKIYLDDTVVAQQQMVTDEKGYFKGRLKSKSTMQAHPQSDYRIHASIDKQGQISKTPSKLPTIETSSELSFGLKGGVSLISDIDDTIKHSAVTLGARELFRNTFVRDLSGLQVAGVKSWYSKLSDLGVSIHYVSNSPWQMWPTLKEFFRLGDLPRGSVHLKAYSGMLAGIFEPAAERKRGNVEGILNDFPERHFMLVGDSGEQDLELYTDVAIRYAPRILAIFMRDVSTPVARTSMASDLTSSIGQMSAQGPSKGESLASQEDTLVAPEVLPSPTSPAPSGQSNMSDSTDAVDEELQKIFSAMNRESETGSLPPSRTSSALSMRSSSFISSPTSAPKSPPTSNPLSVDTKQSQQPSILPDTDSFDKNAVDFVTAATTGHQAAPVATAKKQELWKRRLAWAHEMQRAAHVDVPIHVWRVGSDVEGTALEIARRIIGRGENGGHERKKAGSKPRQGSEDNDDGQDTLYMGSKR